MKKKRKNNKKRKKKKGCGAWCLTAKHVVVDGVFFFYSCIEGQHNTNLQYMFCEGHKSYHKSQQSYGGFN